VSYFDNIALYSVGFANWSLLSRREQSAEQLRLVNKFHLHVNRLETGLRRSWLFKSGLIQRGFCLQGFCLRMNDTAAAASEDNRRNEKALRETQTLRAGCRKAEPKIFAPPPTPLPGERDGQNLISWRWSLPSPTDPVWWRLMHAISSYRGNRTTYTQTDAPQTNPQTGPITIHCAAKLSTQCNNLRHVCSGRLQRGWIAGVVSVVQTCFTSSPNV